MEEHALLEAILIAGTGCCARSARREQTKAKVITEDVEMEGFMEAELLILKDLFFPS